MTLNSSVHDGDVIPMLAALDIFQSKGLPTTHVSRSRTWKTSQVVPMSGRVIFERLSCQAPTSLLLNDDRATRNHRSTSDEIENDSLKQWDQFVRININDGIVALPNCSSGPGSSCPLDDFLQAVRRRGEDIGDFRDICGLAHDAPARISFLHQ